MTLKQELTTKDLMYEIVRLRIALRGYLSAKRRRLYINRLREYEAEMKSRRIVRQTAEKGE